jgi:hypothetical protein
LVTASTPFQQAFLAQSFQYGTDNSSANGDVSFRRLSNSAMVTNLPHVRHDIGETTMSVLEVPFLYAYDFLPLYYDGSASTFSLGAYSANALMAYRTVTGAATPTYKLFVSIHELELIGSAPQVATTVVTQSGMDPKRQEKEELKVSDYLHGAAIGMTAAAAIPALTEFALPTAILLEASSMTARAWGYSRPQVVEQPTRVYRNNYAADCNVDLPSNSYVLAAMQRNELRTDAFAGGTEVDEMAFSYILPKPCQIFEGDMSTTDSVGVTLYSTAICPTNFWFRSNSNRPGGNIALPSSSSLTTNCFYPSTLCYIGSMFRYWRGSLKFRFTFSKTKFHGGRVIAGFVPGTSDVFNNGIVSNTVPAIENGGLPQPFSYCEVFDLRDASSFEFSVPYISPTPYTTVTGSIGGLTLTVLDPLVTTGETASSIDFLVEVGAGDDFYFACPAPPMLSPASNTGTGLVFTQSGMGGVSELPLSVDEHVVGETILSCKTLMMIPTYVNLNVAASSTTTSELWPFWTRSRWTMATPMPTTSSLQFAFSRSGNIAACYAFVVGSTEHHIYSPVSNGIIINAYANERDGNAGAGASDPRSRGQSGKQRVITTDNSLHLRVPQFARVSRVPVNTSMKAYNTTISLGTFAGGVDKYISNFNQFTFTNATSGTVNLTYGRAAADDARCVGWLGPPPVVQFQSLQSVSPDNTGSLII